MAVYVEGLRSAVRDLQKLGVELDDLKDTFAEIASEAATYAALYAPRRSGKLAASIRGNRAKGKAVVTAGKASVPYAGAINYGWNKRNIRPSRFMQRADERIEPVALKKLETGIDKAIDKMGLD